MSAGVTESAGSRMRKSIKSGGYSASLFLVNVVLGFVARGVFIRHLGADLMGLNTSVEGILSLMNVAELGISYAIASSLYGPMARGERETVAELVALQGWVYRRVAAVIVALSLVLMPFFPLLFADASFTLSTAYATFAVYLLSSLLSFFVNYKMVVLDVGQEAYKISLSLRLPSAVRTVLQVVAIVFTDHGYEWWLALNVVSALCSSVMLSWFVRRGHPYLTVPVSDGSSLRRRYPEVGRKVGQLAFHRLASMAMQRSSSVILLGFASLSDVGMYGNYLMILTGVTMLAESLFNGVGAGVGNLVYSSGRAHVLSVFSELLVLRLFVGAACAFGFFVVSPSFVGLWVGEGLVLSAVPTIVLSLTLFVDISRGAVDALVTAKGAFSDIWAAACDFALNIGLSVLFGFYWGLSGVLAGVMVSLGVIALLWKPFFLFRVTMRCGLRLYWATWFRCAAVFVVAAAAALAVWRVLPEATSVSGGFAGALACALLFAVLSAVGLLLTPAGRALGRRIRGLLSKS